MPFQAKGSYCNPEKPCYFYSNEKVGCDNWDDNQRREKLKSTEHTIRESDQSANGIAETSGREGFNWRLPIFGGIGFGAGFALMCGFSSTIFVLAVRAFKHDSLDPLNSPDIAAIRGFIAGAIGGAMLGFAFKDKKYAIHFAIAGAIGFAAAYFYLVNFLNDSVFDIGRFVIKTFFGLSTDLFIEPFAAQGVGIGSVIGAIGGFVLGLASPKGRIVCAFLLAIVGAFWFANAFTFESTIYNGSCSIWNALGGAVGGILLGFALAIFYVIYDKVKSHRTN